jgi:glucan phosphoethanolaminetransferase (alkaline phosphatase superfamily)
VLKVLGWLVLLGFIVFMIACLVATFVDAASQVPGATAYVALLVATIMGAIVVWIVFKAARVPERRATQWVKSIAGPNGRYLFGLFIILWSGFMLALFLLPPEPSGVPNALIGGLAFLGLLAGTFIFLGFVWSIITE